MCPLLHILWLETTKTYPVNPSSFSYCCSYSGLAVQCGLLSTGIFLKFLMHHRTISPIVSDKSPWIRVPLTVVAHVWLHASCYFEQLFLKKLLIHLSILTLQLAAHVLLCGTAATCAFCGPQGGSEQLVTTSSRQMSVCLFTVEAPPPDVLVHEV